MTGSSLLLRCAIVLDGVIRRSEEEAVKAYGSCVGAVFVGLHERFG